MEEYKDMTLARVLGGIVSSVETRLSEEGDLDWVPSWVEGVKAEINKITPGLYGNFDMVSQMTLMEQEKVMGKIVHTEGFTDRYGKFHSMTTQSPNGEYKVTIKAYTCY